MSSAYLESQEADTLEQDAWVRLHPHVERSAEFGEVDLRYVPLAALLDRVPEPPPRHPLTPPPGALTLSEVIDAPVELVHDFVTDLRKRAIWTEGLRDMVGNEPINRVGGAHTCVFENLEVHVVTVDHQATPAGFHYVESGDAGLGVTVVSDFRLTEQNGTTHLTATLVANQVEDPAGRLARLWAAIRKWVFLRSARQGISRSLRVLKSECEALARDEAASASPSPAGTAG